MATTDESFLERLGEIIILKCKEERVVFLEENIKTLLQQQPGDDNENHCILISQQEQSRIIHSIINMCLNILKENLGNDNELETNLLLVRFLLFFRVNDFCIIPPKGALWEIFLTCLKFRRVDILELFLQLRDENKIEHFLLGLIIEDASEHMCIECFQVIMDYFIQEHRSLSIVNNCHLIRLLNNCFLFGRIKFTNLNYYGVSCAVEDLLKIHYEHATSILPSTSFVPLNEFVLLNWSILISSDSKFPLNETTQEDILRLLISFCFEFVDYFSPVERQFETNKIVFQYVNNITDPFLRNRILRSIGLRNRDSDHTNVLGCLKWYLGTFHQDQDCIICYEVLEHIHIRKAEPGTIVKGIHIEIKDEFEFKVVEILSITKTETLLSFLNDLPNIDLFILGLLMKFMKSITVSVRSFREQLIRCEKVINSLVLACLEERETNLMVNEMFTAKYKFIYVIMKLAVVYYEETRIIRSSFEYIGELIHRYGFNNALRCIPNFPVSFHIVDANSDSFFDLLVKFVTDDEMQSPIYIQWFLACGVKFPRKVPQILYRDPIFKINIQGMRTLILFANVITIPKTYEKAGFLNMELLRMLKDMLFEARAF